MPVFMVCYKKPPLYFTWAFYKRNQLSALVFFLVDLILRRAFSSSLEGFLHYPRCSQIQRCRVYGNNIHDIIVYANSLLPLYSATNFKKQSAGQQTLKLKVSRYFTLFSAKGMSLTQHNYKSNHSCRIHKTKQKSRDLNEQK